MNKFGQDHYVTGSGRTLTIYKDEIVRQFSLLANRTVRWSAYMENLLLIPQQAMIILVLRSKSQLQFLLYRRRRLHV